MDTDDSVVSWHYESLPVATQNALRALSGLEWIPEEGWYLAGGTALALHTGNRTSYDLDFFLPQKTFDTKKFLHHFTDNPDWETQIEDTGTIYGILLDTKASFIAYPFFVPKQPPSLHGKIPVLKPIDIAVMKIIAISQRGKKRDFYDLYWCAHYVESLQQIIERLPVQYPSVAHDYHHLLKALVYFQDAESDPDPDIQFTAQWDEIKKFFVHEIPVIADRLIR